MNNIWIATDWHLWNTEYDDGRHKFKSITRLGQLADEYTSVIGTNDLFIHLGDLCDPSNTKPEKLKAIIQSIPGTKILCRGNHDTESDEYYLSAGFDHVCEILKIHDLVFSHKPVNVGVDQINIHGHLHTRKLSTLDGRYLNAYDVNYSDKPILLEDLLQHAIQQTKADYADTEVKQDKIDKMFDSIENDHYENILDLSGEFDLNEQFIQESTQMKSNIDKDFKSKGTKSLSDFKQVKLTEVLRKKYSSTYKMLRHEYADGEKAKGGIITSIAWLDDDNLVAYTSVLKRDDGIYIESLEVTNDYKGYGLGTQLLNYAVDTLHGTILGVAYDNEIAIRMYENKGFKIDPESKEKVESGKSNNYLMIKESSIAPMLHSLSSTEIEKDEDPLDEVIFEDPEDTIYWEQDDTDSKLYKEKEPMAEATSNNVLYHGSKNDMSIITPKNLSQNEDNYVFATPDYSFALCFAANRWDDSIINQSKYNGQLYLTELKPGAMEETFDTDGYMYEVPANKFTKYHNKSSEFISTKSIKPLSKTYIPNILDELNKNGVTISYYPDKPHWWRKTFNEAAFTRYKDDYKPKNKKSINNLKLVKIDKAFIQKYKWVGESLKRNEIYLDRDVAYAWLTKNDKIAARLYITNEDYGDGYKWIALIEIENGYRGNGYGEQVLEFAITHEHGDALGVHKNNTVAINMYKKHGFKISPESQAEVDSGRTNYYQMYRGKGNKNINEAIGAAIMTGMSIASGIANTTKTINDWYKKNDITEYVIFNASENRMYKCIDNTYKFEKTAGIAEKQVDRTFIFLRTSNNLDKKQTERYNIARKYWSKVKSEHKKATKNESIEINEDTKNIKIFDSKPVTVNMIKQYGNEYDMFNHILPDDSQRYTKKNNKKRVATTAWFDNNVPVAIISVLYDGAWRKDHRDGTNRIQGLEVNPDYRNRGIGNQVLNYALDDLHANDIPTSLRVATDNDIAIALYNKNNFETIADKTKDGYNYMLLEHGLNEAVLKSEPDIYYNKEKFDSGEINLCFITGHSGSGKSTMAQNMESKNIETYELDDVNNVSAFSDDNLKEYGDLIYSYFKGPGKKYRVPYQGFTDEWFEENGFGKISSDAKYYGENVNDFVKYAMKYAKSHTNKKFIIEGLQLFCYCNAKDFTNYAVYIKGTSAAKSFFRSLKRDVNYEEGLKAKTQAAYWKIMAAKNYVRHEKMIDAWRKYFSNQMESMNENTLTDSGIEEVTLTAEHLAKLHKAHPELSTILPDDGKDIHDPTKYYCSKVWMQNENVIATASIRYPQANATHYSEIQNINISEGYESYTNSIMNRVNELCDSRITESVMISTTDPVDIYDYKYEVLEEATKGSDILCPVYVILTNSGHASISFNAELKTMYTFGMKQENNTGFGFDVKSINDNHDDNTLYSIYCVFINQAQLKKLKDRVQYFVKHETGFLFDYPGIELTDTNISANSQHRWFCSRFVTDLLNIGSSNKKTQYITDDLSKTNFAHYIYGGSIKNFKSSTVEAQTLRALEQEKNERILRDKKPLNIIQGFQEAAAILSPATREDMNKLNAKWDLRSIGYGDRDKYIAEEEEKLKRMKEHDRKIKEMKDKNKQRIKAEKQAKKSRKLKVKTEEVHDPFNILDQDRFFDWNDYHNTVLGESSFKLELEDKNFQFLMDMNESATGNNKLVPVFVILTHSYSPVSNLVRTTTGDEYTHASISFDSSLTHMYTFGRTSDRSVFEGSFKIEDISSAYYQDHTPPIPYSLFCIPVTEAQKKKMEKKINYFAKNKNKFHFDFFGLFVNAMGIPNNPKNRYFCSRFVSEILNAGDPKNPLVSEPSLQRPYSFADDDYVRFVCSGENIALYDQVVADRIIKDIMRTEKLVRAQKSRVKNENFLGINSSDPFASDVLHYKFAMLDESGMDNFMRYLSSFKIQFDKEGNVIISRKEYDQLDKHFRESVRLCKTYSEAGNVEGIKEELAKVHYMVQLINRYYLSPNANKNPRMKSDIKKDMLDLRSVMLNHFNTYMKWVTIREPQFNFQAYYDTSKYGNTNMVPAKVLTAVGKVLVTAL